MSSTYAWMLIVLSAIQVDGLPSAVGAADDFPVDAVLAFPALLPLLPEELPQAPSILTIMLPNSASESTFLRFFVFINYYPFLFMYVLIPCHSQN